MGAELYQYKYRIQTVRSRNWNYGEAATYFITISTHNRKPWFGQILDQKMVLSEFGTIVTEEWLKTPAIRPCMNLSLDAYVVMPDHFHGILIIGDNCYNQHDCLPVGRSAGFTVGRAAMRGGSTRMNQFGPQSKNLASIVRGFKSAVTIQSRKINSNFQWQQRYYDHIIRDEGSLLQIRQYINQNPSNWKDG